MLRRGLFVLGIAAFPAIAPAGCGGGGSGAENAAARPRSQQQIPFANGYVAGNYNLVTHRVDAFRDHIYAAAAPGQPSKDYCYDLFFGYRRDGLSAWLTGALETSAGYVPGTGIVKLEQRAAGLLFETWLFAPMTAGATQAIVAIVRARNEGADAADCSLFSLVNFHMGGEGQSSAEWAFYAGPGATSGPYVMEGKDGAGGPGTGSRIVVKAIGAAPTRWSYAASGPQSPWSHVNAGLHLVDSSAPLNADDIVCGLEWQIAGGGLFPAGAEAWAGLVLGYTSGGTPAEAAVAQMASDFAGTLTPRQVIDREVAWWQTWHADGQPPAAASAAEIRLFRQSTAVMKMAQCREPGGPEGQLLAWLPPGQWNICWPRDASYAIAALARAGHHAEAKKGLEFFLRGTGDQYRSYVGRKYKISVARYYGSGLEESDDNGNGPNIEFDNFGLFLWALAEYVERANDDAFLATWFTTVRDEVADVLVSLMEPSGLVKADSSIWERHWTAAANTPDGRRRFAYTSINAANGLERAAALATRRGEATKASEWRAAAALIRDGIARELTFSDGAIAASVEEKLQGRAHAADGSVVEAINFGVVAPASSIAAATVAYIGQELRLSPLISPGFLRNDDARWYGPDNWYDRQEWVVIDLRMASALSRMGRRSEARALVDWVGAQGAANFDLIAELYDETSTGYEGAVPMVGFGGGAYLLALYDLYGTN